jgi:hypothetical protein
MIAVASTAHAQRHARADRAIAASLLTTIPGPSSPQWWTGDTAALSGSLRFDVAYAAVRWAEGASPLVVGLRIEELNRDTSGISASIVGLRLGVTRATDSNRSLILSAAEVSLGGRSLRFLRGSSRPEAGFEVVAGRGDFGSRSKGTLGVRFPVELVRPIGAGRLTVYAVPTMAWGRIRTRQCTDSGPGDNCGDLGVQLSFGRTRFALAAGATAAFARSGLALSVGGQRLIAAGHPAQLGAAVSWTRIGRASPGAGPPPDR